MSVDAFEDDLEAEVLNALDQAGDFDEHEADLSDLSDSETSDEYVSNLDMDAIQQHVNSNHTRISTTATAWSDASNASALEDEVEKHRREIMKDFQEESKGPTVRLALSPIKDGEGVDASKIVSSLCDNVGEEDRKAVLESRANAKTPRPMSVVSDVDSVQEEGGVTGAVTAAMIEKEEEEEKQRLAWEESVRQREERERLASLERKAIEDAAREAEEAKAAELEKRMAVMARLREQEQKRREEEVQAARRREAELLKAAEKMRLEAEEADRKEMVRLEEERAREEARRKEAAKERARRDEELQREIERKRAATLAAAEKERKEKEDEALRIARIEEEKRIAAEAAERAAREKAERELREKEEARRQELERIAREAEEARRREEEDRARAERERLERIEAYRLEMEQRAKEEKREAADWTAANSNVPDSTPHSTPSTNSSQWSWDSCGRIEKDLARKEAAELRTTWQARAAKSHADLVQAKLTPDGTRKWSDSPAGIASREHRCESGVTECVELDADMVHAAVGVRSSEHNDDSDDDIAPKGAVPMESIVHLCVNLEGVTSNGATKMLPELRSLDLNGNSLTYIHGLGKNSRLESLSLNDNSIREVSGIGHLPRLWSLSLWMNKVSCIGAGFPQCPNLLELELRQNHISDISGIPNAPQLQKLDLYRNQLTSVASTSQLKSLMYLDAGRNELTAVESSEGTPLLSEAVLYENRIRALPERMDTVLMHKLWLGGNALTSVGAMGWLPMLEYLDLRDNAISSLEPLSNCVILKSLYLAFNRVESTSQLRALAPCKMLRSFSLNDNPVAELPEYRGAVLSLFPWLSQLDNDPVTDEERAINETRTLAKDPTYVFPMMTASRMARGRGRCCNLRVLKVTRESGEVRHPVLSSLMLPRRPGDHKAEYDSTTYASMCQVQAQERTSATVAGRRAVADVRRRAEEHSKDPMKQQKLKGEELDLRFKHAQDSIKMARRHFAEHANYDPIVHQNIVVPNLAYEKRALDQRQGVAAVMLQRVARGYMVRHARRRESTRQSAALTIQRFRRGSVVRRGHYALLKREREIKLSRYSIVIQALARGFIVRTRLRRARLKARADLDSDDDMDYAEIPEDEYTFNGDQYLDVPNPFLLGPEALSPAVAPIRLESSPVKTRPVGSNREAYGPPEPAVDATDKLRQSFKKHTRSLSGTTKDPAPLSIIPPSNIDPPAVAEKTPARSPFKSLPSQVRGAPGPKPMLLEDPDGQEHHPGDDVGADDVSVISMHSDAHSRVDPYAEKEMKRFEKNISTVKNEWKLQDDRVAAMFMRAQRRYKGAERQVKEKTLSSEEKLARFRRAQREAERHGAMLPRAVNKEDSSLHTPRSTCSNETFHSGAPNQKLVRRSGAAPAQAAPRGRQLRVPNVMLDNFMNQENAHSADSTYAPPPEPAPAFKFGNIQGAGVQQAGTVLPPINPGGVVAAGPAAFVRARGHR